MDLRQFALGFFGMNSKLAMLTKKAFSKPDMSVWSSSFSIETDTVYPVHRFVFSGNGVGNWVRHRELFLPYECFRTKKFDTFHLFGPKEYVNTDPDVLDENADLKLENTGEVVYKTIFEYLWILYFHMRECLKKSSIHIFILRKSLLLFHRLG